jgi:hypothetical protein
MRLIEIPVRRNPQLILVPLLVFGASVVGANQARRPTTAHPAQNDSAFARWVEFKSKEGKFTILFPSAPKVRTPDDHELVDGLPMYYATYQSSIKYSAIYIDYPENLEAPVVSKDVLDRARDAGIAGSAEAQERPRILSETDINFEGHPARLLRIAMSGGRSTWCKFIVVKNRFYFLEVVLPKPNGKTSGAEAQEKIARFFLDSFRLIPEVA